MPRCTMRAQDSPHLGKVELHKAPLEADNLPTDVFIQASLPSSYTTWTIWPSWGANSPRHDGGYFPSSILPEIERGVPRTAALHGLLCAGDARLGVPAQGLALHCTARRNEMSSNSRYFILPDEHITASACQAAAIFRTFAITLMPVTWINTDVQGRQASPPYYRLVRAADCRL